jgi:hypothetical protein
VLQATDDHGRGHAEIPGERRDLSERELAEPALLLRRDQGPRREAVGLSLEPIGGVAVDGGTVSLEEDVLLAMQSDVGRLVKERKPQDVLPAIAQAQLDQRIGDRASRLHV